MARIRFAALGAALVIASATAGAQATPSDRPAAEGHGDRGDRGEGRRNRMFKGIELSAQQKQEVKAIHAKYRDQYASRQGNRQHTDSARAQRREAMREQFAKNSQLRQQEMADIRGVLTADQRVTFDRNVAELKARMQERANKGQRKQRGQKIGT